MLLLLKRLNPWHALPTGRKVPRGQATPSKSKRPCPKIRVAFKKGKVEQGRCGHCIAEVMRANPSMTQDDARKVKGVSQPRVGCDVCEEYICKKHWHLH